jgi:hypothetical protein
MQKFAPDALNTELQAIEKSIQVYWYESYWHCKLVWYHRYHTI